MAGRGRGRGRIQIPGEKGFIKPEILPPVLQPPPDFPPLEHKPLPTTIPNEMRYMLTIQKDFIDHWKNSLDYIKVDVVQKDIERFLDLLAALESNDKESYVTRIDWDITPDELQPKQSKKNKRKSGIEKTIVTKARKLLEVLEQEENVDTSDNEMEVKDKNNDEDSDNDVGEEVDEDVDDGTDYAMSYFDNGENNEEDDDTNEDDAFK